MEKYEYLLVKSKEIWEESIAGGGYKKKDPQSDAAPPSKVMTNNNVAVNSNAVKPDSSQSGRRATQNGFTKGN